MGEFLLSNKIKMLNKYSNIDKFYGPYYIGEDDPFEGKYRSFSTIEGLEEALGDIADVGLTVGIINNNKESILEYWFLKGSGDKLELTEKGFNLRLENFEITVFPSVFNNNLYSVKVSYPSLGKLIGGQVKFYIDGGNPKFSTSYNESGDSYNFTNVSIGTHVFKIVITDALGNSCYGESDPKNIGYIKFNLLNNTLNSIRALKLINTNNLRNLNLTFNVEVLSGDIDNYGLYGDNTKLSLTLDNSSYTYNNWDAVDGKTIYFRAYNRSREMVYEEKLFEILGSNVLYGELRNPNQKYNFVIGIERTITIIFSSGASSMNISCDPSSDFSFSPAVINFHPSTGKSTYSLKVTPNNTTENLSNLKIQYSNSKPPLIIPIYEGIKEISDSERSVVWEDFELFNSSSYKSCFIDFTTTLYPSLDDDDHIITFNDLMWIDNNVIHVGTEDNNIEIATPLGERVYIGMGYGIEGTSDFEEIYNNDKYRDYIYFDFICVNGAIVKVSPSGIDSVLSLGKQLRETLGGWKTPGYNIEKDSSNKEKEYIEVNTGSIRFSDLLTKIESHYLEDFDITREDISLPTLELSAISYLADDFLNKWNSKLFKISVFGDITDGFNKEESIVNFISDPKLFKFSEKLKKERPREGGKKYKPLEVFGVPCEYNYYENGALADSGKVIVYTLGTSTLRYLIPNFKLYFLEDFNLVYLEAEVDSNGSTTKNELAVTEKIYTAKADYMESAHLNNTPLAILYNKITKNLDDKYECIPEKDKTPSDYDAIVGKPINIKIKDLNELDFRDLGIFMLNTDKVSTTLGFSNDYEYISLEGNNNDTNNSLSRFICPQDFTWPNSENWSDVEGIDDIMSQIEDKGLEIRATSESDEKAFLIFYNKYWKVINDTNNENYKADMESILNLPYCQLYIIIMMVFGLSDNVGKNCMFDVWKSDGEWGKLTPRFYDLDSSNGLNNAGKEEVLPYALVSKEWTPDNGRSNLYESGSHWNYKYIKNIPTLFQYSSHDSLLWNFVYNNYQPEINTMYKNLRDNYLSFNYLKNHFEKVVLNVVPYYMYNLDFKVKYLQTNNQDLMYGNRKTNFFDWLLSRLSFCDSFFKYKLEKYHVNSKFSINPCYMFPAYIAYDQGGQGGDKDQFIQFGTTPIINDAGGSGSQVTTVYLADKIVTKFDNNTSLYNTTSIRLIEGNQNFEFENLKELSIKGGYCPNLDFCKNLLKLELPSTVLTGTIQVPNSVRTLTRKAVKDPITGALPSTLRINISNDSLIEELDLNYCTLSSYNLSSLTHLKKITLTNCTISGSTENDSFTLPNTKGIIFKTEDCVFNDIMIASAIDTEVDALELNNQTVPGFNLGGKIRKLDLYNSTIPATLDLSNVTGVEVLNLVKSNINYVLVGENTFSNNLTLGVLDSLLESIDFNGNSDSINLNVFEGKTVTSIINSAYTDPQNIPETISRSPIRDIYDVRYSESLQLYECTDPYSSGEYHKMLYGGLSFARTKVKKVIGNNVTINGYALFSNCEELTSVNCTNVKLNSYWVFYNCPKLRTLAGVKISKFIGAFYKSGLNYNSIELAIDSSSTDGNFQCFMLSYKGGQTISIDGSKYPTIKNAFRMFCKTLPNDHFDSNNSGTIRNITIANPFDCSASSILEMFFECGTITINSQLFNNYNTITNAVGAFVSCTVDNINVLHSMPNLINASGMYCLSIINSKITNQDNKLILLNQNLENCTDLFNATTFRNDSSIIIDDFILGIRSRKIYLTDCFLNAKNSSGDAIVYILDNLNINENTLDVYITGFLAKLLSYNSSDINTKVVYNSKFIIELNVVGYRNLKVSTIGKKNLLYYFGPYSNRNTTLTEITLGQDINHPSNLAYYLCLLQASNGLVITINYPSSLERTFFKTNGISRLLVSINLNITAFGAFNGSTFASGFLMPENIMDHITVAEEMFAGSNLTTLTNLHLSSTVTNVKRMFSKCRFLKGGVPSDFYTNLSTDVKDFTRIFYGTLITTTNQDLAFSPFPSHTEIVEGALAAVRFMGSSGTFNSKVNIPPGVTNIEGLFALSDVSINGVLVLDHHVKADYAFVNRSDDRKLGVTSSIGIHAYTANYPGTIPSYNSSDNTYAGQGAYYGWNNYPGDAPPNHTFYYSNDALNEKGNNNLNPENV